MTVTEMKPETGEIIISRKSAKRSKVRAFTDNIKSRLSVKLIDKADDDFSIADDVEEEAVDRGPGLAERVKASFLVAFGRAESQDKPESQPGPGSVSPGSAGLQLSAPWLEVTSTTLGVGIPFLAESGAPLPGAVIGLNLQSRSPFCADPWQYYSGHIIRSLDTVILGAKGAGKSMLAKSWATRLIRFGAKIAVPHDPNGEWAKVAEAVDGKVIQLGLGAEERLNPFDIGRGPAGVNLWQWEKQKLQQQRATLRAMIKILRGHAHIDDMEHTAIDVAVEEATDRKIKDEITITDILAVLLDPESQAMKEVAEASTKLAHTLRRLVHGDAAGLFDGQSTVTFDNDAPMVVVDTSLMRHASMEAQALLRLATQNWIKNATQKGNKTKRVIIHEEAAIALLAESADEGGLVDQVVQEKTSRHLGISNWYLLHRISDLDALGDQGSALQTRGLGLLADADLRIIMSQQVDAMPRTTETLGLNAAHSKIIPQFEKGEALWIIGDKRTARVKHVVTPGELREFATDSSAGERRVA